MIRLQVQFTEEQAEKLKRLSAAEGRSIAALVRESVDAHILSTGADARSRRVARALSAVGKFRSNQPDLGVNHDRHLAKIYGE